MELKIKSQARGVRIITGDEAKGRRALLNRMTEIAEYEGFEEIILPSVEPTSLYVNKAGDEIRGQMYIFPDKKGRDLCLRPEGTATLQLIAEKYFKSGKDARLWYFERCCDMRSRRRAVTESSFNLV